MKVRSTQVVRNALRKFGVPSGAMYTNKRADHRTVKCYVGDIEMGDTTAARGKVLRDLRKAGFSGCSVHITDAKGPYKDQLPANGWNGFIVNVPYDY